MKARREKPAAAVKRRADAVLYVRCKSEQREAWQAAADADYRSLAQWVAVVLDAAAASAASQEGAE